VVYTAQRLSLAMLEYLVHLDADRPPGDIMLAKADVPEDVSRIQITTNDLPRGWRSYPPAEAWRQSVLHLLVNSARLC
jgi:hypothetical protein